MKTTNKIYVKNISLNSVFNEKIAALWRFRHDLYSDYSGENVEPLEKLQLKNQELSGKNEQKQEDFGEWIYLLVSKWIS